MSQQHDNKGARAALNRCDMMLASALIKARQIHTQRPSTATLPLVRAIEYARARLSDIRTEDYHAPQIAATVAALTQTGGSEG